MWKEKRAMLLLFFWVVLLIADNFKKILLKCTSYYKREYYFLQLRYRNIIYRRSDFNVNKTVKVQNDSRESNIVGDHVDEKFTNI